MVVAFCYSQFVHATPTSSSKIMQIEVDIYTVSRDQGPWTVHRGLLCVWGRRRCRLFKSIQWKSCRHFASNFHLACSFHKLLPLSLSFCLSLERALYLFLPLFHSHSFTVSVDLVFSASAAAVAVVLVLVLVITVAVVAVVAAVFYILLYFNLHFSTV